RVAGGKSFDGPVSFLDVAPTLLKLAGADKQGVDGLEGTDLLATLAASAPPARDFYWKLGQSSALRAGDWKLIVSGGSRWLFDLAKDPLEKTDLLDAEPEKAAKLGADLAAWVAKQPPAAWTNDKLDSPIPVLNKGYWIEY